VEVAEGTTGDTEEGVIVGETEVGEDKPGGGVISSASEQAPRTRLSKMRNSEERNFMKNLSYSRIFIKEFLYLMGKTLIAFYFSRA
jgi:hypothetical protein